ncbi:hypothetical protein NMY22_g13200 [Coprinellus aureogranulatus]|nr:hypothetical protein NMY22_g13200 [Coprinellus aureogranulatus]
MGSLPHSRGAVRACLVGRLPSEIAGLDDAESEDEMGEVKRPGASGLGVGGCRKAAEGKAENKAAEGLARGDNAAGGKRGSNHCPGYWGAKPGAVEGPGVNGSGGWPQAILTSSSRSLDFLNAVSGVNGHALLCGKLELTCGRVTLHKMSP